MGAKSAARGRHSTAQRIVELAGRCCCRQGSPAASAARSTATAQHVGGTAQHIGGTAQPKDLGWTVGKRVGEGLAATAGRFGPPRRFLLLRPRRAGQPGAPSSAAAAADDPRKPIPRASRQAAAGPAAPSLPPPPPPHPPTHRPHLEVQGPVIQRLAPAPALLLGTGRRRTASARGRSRGCLCIVPQHTPHGQRDIHAGVALAWAAHVAQHDTAHQFVAW